MLKENTLITFALLYFFCGAVSAEDNGQECRGKYGRTIKPELLLEILDSHKRYLWQLEGEKRLANLCGVDLFGINMEGRPLNEANFKDADLTGAILSGADLQDANFEGAHLNGANLCGADLSDAHFEGAWLRGSTLKGVRFYGAHFNNANLMDVDLEGAKLNQANLKGATIRSQDLQGVRINHAHLEGANLIGVDLHGANFTEAHLEDAKLIGADLSGAKLIGTYIDGTNFQKALMHDVKFEAISNSKLLARNFAEAKGLWSMYYTNSSDGLSALRNAFKEAGMRDREREITYAIRHSALEILTIKSKKQRDILGLLESMFLYIAFEATTEWGMRPGLALGWLATLIIIFSNFYLIALQAPESKSGIWRIRSKERLIDVDQDSPKEIRELIPFAGFWRSVPYALYFSLLSAFHFGWRDLNVGNWIARLQFYEYNLRGTGWVRMVSGLQSLLCVYLLAIWALTYFGRPFE